MTREELNLAMTEEERAKHIAKLKLQRDKANATAHRRREFINRNINDNGRNC